MNWKHALWLLLLLPSVAGTEGPLWVDSAEVAEVQTSIDFTAMVLNGATHEQVIAPRLFIDSGELLVHHEAANQTVMGANLLPSEYWIESVSVSGIHTIHATDSSEIFVVGLGGRAQITASSAEISAAPQLAVQMEQYTLNPVPAEFSANLALQHDTKWRDASIVLEAPFAVGIWDANLIGPVHSEFGQRSNAIPAGPAGQIQFGNYQSSQGFLYVYEGSFEIQLTDASLFGQLHEMVIDGHIAMHGAEGTLRAGGDVVSLQNESMEVQFRGSLELGAPHENKLSMQFDGTIMSATAGGIKEYFSLGWLTYSVWLLLLLIPIVVIPLRVRRMRRATRDPVLAYREARWLAYVPFVRSEAALLAVVSLIRLGRYDVASQRLASRGGRPIDPASRLFLKARIAAGLQNRTLARKFARQCHSRYPLMRAQLASDSVLSKLWNRQEAMV